VLLSDVGPLNLSDPLVAAPVSQHVSWAPGGCLPAAPYGTEVPTSDHPVAVCCATDAMPREWGSGLSLIVGDRGLSTYRPCPVFIS
jgi:hypothetical protein